MSVKLTKEEGHYVKSVLLPYVRNGDIDGLHRRLIEDKEIMNTAEMRNAYAFLVENIPKKILEYRDRLNEREFSTTGISSIIIPGSIKYIDKSCFMFCKQLSEIKFEEGVEHIGEDAFYGTALTEIILPNSIKTLGSDCFCNDTYYQPYNVYIPKTMLVLPRKNCFKGHPIIHMQRVPGRKCAPDDIEWYKNCTEFYDGGAY